MALTRSIVPNDSLPKFVTMLFLGSGSQPLMSMSSRPLNVVVSGMPCSRRGDQRERLERRARLDLVVASPGCAGPSGSPDRRTARGSPPVDGSSDEIDARMCLFGTAPSCPSSVPAANCVGLVDGCRPAWAP